MFLTKAAAALPNGLVLAEQLLSSTPCTGLPACPVRHPQRSTPRVPARARNAMLGERAETGLESASFNAYQLQSLGPLQPLHICAALGIP